MTDFSATIDGNPLLQGLPIDIGQVEWGHRLRYDPLKGHDVQMLSPFRRDLLLDTFTDSHVPTAKTTEIAYQMHRMLIGGLARRDPRDEAARQAVYAIARSASQRQIDVPCFSTWTRGILLQGITKQGKSRLLKRVLSQYPQVIERGLDHEGGWLELKQLVYLVIPMPSDASRGGFLLSGFIELDKVLGTSYAKDTRIRNSSIEVQLVAFLALLAVHRCGMLVIEEAQDANELASARFGRDYTTFFLRVLNTGIPTVLVGNPKAFDDLKTNAQLMSRLSDPGMYELHPSPTADSPEWKHDFVPHLWGKNLLPEPDDPIPNLEQFLWDHTGGFVHYLNVLRRETLRAALDKGASRVTAEHIKAAARTSAMEEGKRISANYWAGVNDQHVSYTDLPGNPDPSVIRSRRKQRGRTLRGG